VQTTGVDLWAWRLLDVAGEPFVSTDGDGTVVAWNRAAERALGWPAKDALGQDFCELVVPPRLREAHRARLRTLCSRFSRETGETRLELSLIDRGGHEAPVEVTLIALEVDGRPLAHAFVHDLARPESAQRVSAVFAAARDAIATTDRRGVVTSWNQAAERLTGYSAEEAVGRSLVLLLPAGDGEERHLLDAAAGGRVAELLGVERVRRDGRRISIDITISPLSDAAGEIMGAALVARPARGSIEHELGRWERRIREACRTPGAVRVALQPMIDLEDARVSAYEALARFATGPASPAEWFAAAAELGLDGMFEARAIAAALARREDLPPGCAISVNVSPLGLVTGDVQQALADAGDLSDVIIEITEQSPVSDYAELQLALDGPRRRGARVAIDDTGAGYASLRHVLGVAPDLVKIDRSLVAGIDYDPAKAAVVETLRALATRIDADLVAEGVERTQELAALLRLDVRFAQGYLLGAPSPEPAAFDAGLLDSVRPAAR